MYSKNSFKMLVIVLTIFGLSSIEAFSAAVAWDGGAATTNWFDAANWDNDAVPTDADDVTIGAAFTVNVNGNAVCNSLTVEGTLRPDASAARTIEVDENLTVAATGSIKYTDAGGTGRLSWTLNADGGTRTIDNLATDEADLEFYDLTIEGTIVTAVGANRGDINIYGDLTVNGAFNPSIAGAAHSTIYFADITTEGQKTITNNGTMTLNNIVVNALADITTNTDLIFEGNLTVNATGSLAFANPSVVTVENSAVATSTITNNGTLSFATGTSFNINSDLTIAQDLTSVGAAVTIQGGIDLTITGGEEFGGTGSLTTNAASGVIVDDAAGLTGALSFATYTWNATTNITIESGTTGFAGVSLSTIGDLTIGTETGAALAITTEDTFTMSGALAITENTGAVTSFTANSGTITMSGGTINANDETLSFYGLNITGAVNLDESLSTLGAGEGTEGFTITNSFAIQTGATLDLDNATAGDEAYTIIFTGTNSIEVVDSDGFDILADAAGPVAININGTTTLLDDLDFDDGAGSSVDNLTITVGATGTLDFQNFVLTVDGAASSFATAAEATLKTSAPTGLAGNLTTAAAVTINADVNLEYNNGATSLGLEDVDGQGTDLLTVEDITINGAAITSTDATPSTVVVTGDFYLQTGSVVFANAADIISMGSVAGSEIINDQSAASLDFQSLVIVGGQTVTTDDDFTISGDLATAIDVQAGAFTASSPSTIFFEGSGGTQGMTNAGTLTFHNLTVDDNASNVDVVAGDVINITGNLTVDGTGTGLIGGAASTVVFSGSAQQTIDVDFTNSALNLDLVTVSNAVGVVTDDEFTVSNNGGAVTISGIFTASSPSNITFGATGNFDVTNGTATFFDITIAAGTVVTTTVGAGDIFLTNNLTGADADADFDLSGATTLNIIGNTADTDPITNDGKLEALIDVGELTIDGTVVIPSTAELQLNNQTDAIAGAGIIDVNGGRVEFIDDNAFAGGTVDIQTNGTIHLSGATATADLTATAGTLTNTDNTGDAIIDGAQTTLVGGVLNIDDLRLNSTGPLAFEAADNITLHGTLNQTGTAMVAGGIVDGSLISMTGADSRITGTTAIAVGEIDVEATATGATMDATQLILGSTTNAQITVADGGVLTASDGEVIIDDIGGGAGIDNNSTATGALTLHDLTITTTGSVPGLDADLIISGSFDHTANGIFIATGSGDVTFSGTNETITVDNGAAATAEVEFQNLIITGSIDIDNDDELDWIDVSGDLTVSGALTMTDGALNFDGGGAQAIANTGTLQIHDFDIENGVITSSSNYTINGDLTQTGGSLTNTSNSVRFEGTATVLGTAEALTFNDVVFAGTTTLGAGALDIVITGDITVNNGSSAEVSDGADEINLNGATTKSITNNGTLTFGDLVLENVADNNVTTASSLTILDDFTVGDDATFEATNGVVTINLEDAAATLTAGDADGDVTFNDLTVTSTLAGNPVLTIDGGGVFVTGDITATLGSATDLEINFATNSIPLVLNGTTQQSISLEGSGVLGTSAKLITKNITLNNSEGLQLSNTGSAIVVDQFNVEGNFRLQNGEVDLNGDNVITIDVAGGGVLQENYSNSSVVTNTGASSATGHIYATVADPTLSSLDLGGLGAIFTSATPNVITGGNTLTVRRYHIPREIGGNTQVERYYSIVENEPDDLGVRLELRYDESELGSLTEDDLLLLYSDNELNTEPWFVQEASVETDINRVRTELGAIDNLSGETEWWTMGSPSTISATEITDGLVSNTELTAGSLGNAIFGVQFTTTGSDIGLTDVRFEFGRALANSEFTSFAIVYSQDDDYSTTEDNVTLYSGTNAEAQISGGGVADNFIEFDVSAVDTDKNTVAVGAPINYFLVVDVAATANLTTPTVTPQMDQSNVTITDGVANQIDLTGETYSFRAGIEIEPNENGISDAPLVAGAQDQGIFGFKAEITDATSSPGFTGFTLSFDNDPTVALEDIKVYISSDSDFETAGDNSPVAADVTAGTNSYEISFDAQQNLNTTPKYYFITADVKNTVNSGTPAITPTLVYSSITSTNAGVRGTDGDGNAATEHSGYTYDFVGSGVTISNANNPEASNLGISVPEQTVYGFRITPDNDQTIVFDDFEAYVTFGASEQSADFDQWRLYRDDNGNGYGESSEKIADGTYNADGSLEFSNFSESLSEATDFVVAVRVRSSSDAGATVSVSALSSDYFTFDSPAKANAGGPYPSTAIAHTVAEAGAATQFEIVNGYSTEVISGDTISLVVRAIDANGNPARLTTGTTVEIVKDAGDGTVGGTSSAAFASGRGFIVISPELSHGSVSNDLQLRADRTGAGSVNNSDPTDEITILEAAPTDNSGYVDFTDITATSIGIDNVYVPATPGNGRIVVMRQGAKPEAPTNGQSYVAATGGDIAQAGAVGVGQTGPGSYVVYTSGDGIVTDQNTSIDVIGLTPNTRYYFMVFEYEGTGSDLTYATGTSWTSDTDQNPVYATTLEGALSNADQATAPLIQTNIDVTSAIDASEDVDWFRFRVDGNKTNARLILSNLPANYHVEVYEGAGLELKRQSEVSGTSDEVLIMNGLSAATTYYIKVYGADTQQFSTTNYTLRVSTSANEFYSLTEE